MDLSISLKNSFTIDPVIILNVMLLLQLYFMNAVFQVVYVYIIMFQFKRKMKERDVLGVAIMGDRVKGKN